MWRERNREARRNGVKVNRGPRCRNMKKETRDKEGVKDTLRDTASNSFLFSARENL